MLIQFFVSIPTLTPAGKIGLNARVAHMIKPSVGASNKGRLVFASILYIPYTFFWRTIRPLSSFSETLAKQTEMYGIFGQILNIKKTHILLYHSYTNIF